MYDVIIIGAGPAGLTSAIYLRRANKKVLVVEASTYGGAIVNATSIENYPACPNITGFDFATNLYNQVKDLKTEIKFEKVINIKSGKIKKVITKNNTYLGKSIILATGLSRRKLDIPNENELTGHGISYCATCDGNFYKDKIVAVVGGGNTALDDALYLSSLAKKVYVIHRRDTFRADARTISLLQEKDNVSFVLNSEITKLNGNDLLESIEIINKEKESTKIIVDGLFVAIGSNPVNECFKDIVVTSSDGFVKDKNLHTNRRGIFVAGDVREKCVRQLVTATSDGAIAATEAINYLNNESM